MQDKEHFEEVAKRLMDVLNLKTDTALASALGFKVSAYGNRKARGVLPRLEIDDLIQAKGLNPQWVYQGVGPRFISGEYEEQIRRDLEDLKDQIRAMALHRASQDLLESLFKGVLYGDAEAVQQWLSKATDMDDTERQLVQAFRTAPPHVRASMQGLAALAVDAANGGKSVMTFHGNVGQAVGGNVNTAGIAFHSAERPPVKWVKKPTTPRK
jgi:hypothetical protein